MSKVLLERKAKREEKDIKDVLQYSPELLEKYGQK